MISFRRIAQRSLTKAGQIGLTLVSALLVACGGGGTSTTTTTTTVADNAITVGGTAAIAGAVHVVANTRQTYTATAGGSAYSWAWGDGSDNTAGNPAVKVWHAPGTFSTAVGVVNNGSLAAASLTSTVADPLATGSLHTCALRPDGTVSCWGHNSNGELGDGNTAIYANPTIVGLKDAIALASGTSFSCALKSDATVVCWGKNNFGQLGDGTTTDRAAPVAVSGLSNVVAINAGLSHVCAVKADSTVVCWGQNVHGELGIGNTIAQNTPSAVLGVGGVGFLSGVVSVASGYAYSCALKADATVVCWGVNTHGELGQANGLSLETTTPKVVPNLTGVVVLRAGSNHACGLKNDNSVWCWGFNGYGQLGDGTTVTKDYPVAVQKLSGNAAAIAASTAQTLVVKSIALGEYHSCALGDAGSVICWGANTYGQLGVGTTINSSIPLATNAFGIALSLGNSSTCYLQTDGSVRCSGNNSQHQLANNTTVDSLVFVPMLVDGMSGPVYWK